MSTQRMHLLVVEDNPRDIQLLRHLASQAAAVQITWEQVEQLSLAIDLLRQTPFDLVLLDLSLPDSHGLESFRRLYPHALCLPIVILTTLEAEPQAVQAVQAGAQDYFVKQPLEGTGWLRTLRQAIERKQTEIRLRLQIRALSEAAQQLEHAVQIGYELQTILSSLAALLAQLPTDDQKHTDLQWVHDEVDRMDRLIANLVQLNQHRPARMAQFNQPETIPSTPALIEDLRAHNILTIHDEQTYFLETLEAGTAGYLLPGSAIKDLMGRIHQVLHESLPVPLRVDPRELHHDLERPKTAGRLRDEELSPREQAVLQLIARGRTNKEIAKRLSISVRTVERHRSSIMNKIGLQNRTELVIYAVQRGLLGGHE